MYPKTFTSRKDHHASVVVANAEQEAQLPEEYLPAPSGTLVGAGGQAGAGSTASPAETLLLSPEYAEFQADLDKLEVERANLTAGYKADKALLDADRELFEAERAQFEADKRQALLDVPAFDAKDEAPSDTPTKRARAGKE